MYIPHVYDGRNKTFWFFTYAGFWQPAAITVNSSESTPTAAMVQGNFTGLQTIYDPNNVVGGVRQAFANNAIPTARFSKISKQFPSVHPTAERGEQCYPFWQLHL